MDLNRITKTLKAAVVVHAVLILAGAATAFATCPTCPTSSCWSTFGTQVIHNTSTGEVGAWLYANRAETEASWGYAYMAPNCTASTDSVRFMAAGDNGYFNVHLTFEGGTCHSGEFTFYPAWENYGCVETAYTHYYIGLLDYGLAADILQDLARFGQVWLPLGHIATGLGYHLETESSFYSCQPNIADLHFEAYANCGTPEDGLVWRGWVTETTSPLPGCHPVCDFDIGRNGKVQGDGAALPVARSTWGATKRLYR